MSAALMTAPIAEPSPRFRARATGLFWLLTMITGTVAMAVSTKLIAGGDAATTAANIVGNESLYRFGMAANLVATICYLAATLFVYDLLKPVNRNLSLGAAFFSLAGCALSGLGFVFYLAPLIVFENVNGFSVEQMQTLSRVFLRLNEQAANVAFVFFGLHCALVGRLIYRSRFLPRFVGVLMLCAGLGWMTGAFANVLAPQFARSLFPWIMLPGVVGEGSLTLWLLIAGVNVARWNEQAAAQ